MGTLHFSTSRNMKTFVAVFTILALFACAEGMPGADCYRKSREFPTWEEESEININYRNKDGTTSSFDCTCAGSACQELNCKNLNVPEEKEKQEETPVIKIDDGGVYDYEDESETNTVEDDEGCYSEVLKKYVTRGATVIHPGTPSKGCKCTAEGNDLVCIELGCNSLPTPNVEYPYYIKRGNCFDPWLNREIDHGSSYDRVRKMSEYQSVTGTYSCSCNLGSIRCTATDIPCCDSKSKEFKDYGEVAHMDYGALTYACTCKRGRSLFRNCRHI